MIDIQNDYFPGGRMELSGSLEASLRAREALEHFRKTGDAIFHIQHVSLHPGAAFFLPDTGGVQIHENVKPGPAEPVIKKNFPNSFRSTTLLEMLRSSEIRNLAICGMMSHMCVDATVRAAFDFGFGCTVLHDACATRSLEFGGAAIPAPQVHGAFMAAFSPIYAKVVSVREYLSK